MAIDANDIAMARGVDALREDFDKASEQAPLPLTIADWLARDLPEPDYLMGSWLTTTSRALFVAPTGLGKTNFGLALAGHVSAGADFLHWRGQRPARVLFIDGEMSRRLLKVRLTDMVRRLGQKPSGLHVLSHEDIGEVAEQGFHPLNKPEGQQAVERVIERIGDVDFIEFDNIMSLISGDMKDEEGWREILPWVRSLTRRNIGQLWIHHTGHDESRSYGTKTREWQMDTVMHLTAVEREGTEISFDLEFRKARERTPKTRADFEMVRIALTDDKWNATAAGTRRKDPSPTGRKYLDALKNVLATDAVVTINNRRAAADDAWKAECLKLGLLDKSLTARGNAARFSKYRIELVTRNHVACDGNLTWLA